MSKKDRPALRCMLYSLACPGGQIFAGDDAIDAAIEDGWKDTPPPAELLAQTATEADERDASALESLTAANIALVDELNAVETDLQAAEADLAKETKRADAAEKKLATAASKGGKGAASK